jgi:arginyl-tRNA synthetase
VRAKNIGRKLRAAELEAEVPPEAVRELRPELLGDDLWELVHAVARTAEVVEKAAATLEISLVARHGLELAQSFHALYHHHPVLHESDPELRRARLAVFQVFARGLRALCDLLGVPEPERM